MEISVEITKEDYLNFNKFYFQKKKSKQRYIRTGIFSVLLALLVRADYTFDLEAFILITIGTFVFQLLMLQVFLPPLMKLMGHTPAKNGSILGKRVFRITDEGITEESENSTSFHKWKSVKSVDENDRSLFIFVDTIAAYIIPKRYFENDEHLASFSKLVEEHVERANL
ncbi:YcxB family protein [Desertivirga brevis]|uniref:YcxB family protein n=1 Tax=Desertivirga brevis TaxID=2810310 RepID=UPI001A96B07F|nr:YcxB family protein [Pedobacter sp. SYSU D00873]